MATKWWSLVVQGLCFIAVLPMGQKLSELRTHAREASEFSWADYH